jgi:DNA-binding protein HU-beta
MAKAAAKKKSHTKAELIEALAKNLDTTKTGAAEAFDGVIDLLKDSLKKNKTVTVPQFGTFTVQSLKARKGRNPRTGEPLKIAASKTVRFKPSAGLKSQYNK